MSTTKTALVAAALLLGSASSAAALKGPEFRVNNTNVSCYAPSRNDVTCYHKRLHLLITMQSNGLLFTQHTPVAPEPARQVLKPYGMWRRYSFEAYAEVGIAIITSRTNFTAFSVTRRGWSVTSDPPDVWNR